MFSLLLALACSAPAEKSDPEATVDTAPPGDSAGAQDSADGTPLPTLTLRGPDLLPSEGSALADRCDWVLPAVHACEGPSPALAWEGLPDEAVELLLMLDDPDAGDWPHWAVLHLPVDAAGLDAGVSQSGQTSTLPAGAVELENGAGYTGYFGSCPPTAHVYRWRLWALPTAAVDPGRGGAKANFRELAAAADATALSTATLCHIYDPDAP
jgi:hypothetical protein